MITVSIISHHNTYEITSILKPHKWTKETDNIRPIILSNDSDNNLKEYCQKNNIEYVENKRQEGFGSNNNKVFNLAYKNINISDKDVFFCINPDVETNADTLQEIEKIMLNRSLKIAAPDLKNKKGEHEDNIRMFPTLKGITLRFLLKSKTSNINKKEITNLTTIDWASGAFLCFNAKTYQKLSGFDECYYMYYEDADICKRAAHLGIQTHYIPEISSIHSGKRKSRSILSQHFYWHIKSALRFLIK